MLDGLENYNGLGRKERRNGKGENGMKRDVRSNEIEI